LLLGYQINSKKRDKIRGSIDLVCVTTLEVSLPAFVIHFGSHFCPFFTMLNPIQNNPLKLNSMNNDVETTDQVQNPSPIFFFAEGEKYKEISFDLLCQSKAYLNSNRKPPESRPVEAYELIEEVNAILDKYGIIYYMQPILVQANGSENVMTRKERAEIPANETPIDTWVFNKILIQWIFAFEGDLKPGISCAFHDKGIDFAFGLYNRVCTNHCIFGDKWFTTYTAKRSQKKSYSDLMNALRVWLDDYEANISIDLAMARMMMDKLFIDQDSDDIIDSVMGALLRLAVRQNMPGVVCDAPFNITSVCKITRGFEGMILERHGIGGEFHEISLWEIYNAGTALLKPSDTDISDIHFSNKEWGTFLINRYLPNSEQELSNLTHEIYIELTNITSKDILEDTVIRTEEEAQSDNPELPKKRSHHKKEEKPGEA
jgi:hypothetical protein